ncbi:MAG: ubiquitin-activating enzyme E1 [Edafosvirus sp.]|uniref:Ubiquitin-activating enzyme E1 n=1 Tax=Edafosvirus sp. TaxID=2487765 RepID=A0A3G4ZX42_9VIRU|nr:MAG: ubiquitin-activating enzyme E1 [Edafosvirus sp.]
MQKIDESLYSRQLYVLGHDAMEKMRHSSVLISGLGGLGVEIAKNVILSGVKHVTLHDTSKTTYHDLSSQYYLSDKDLKKNRATSCVKKLASLNPYVDVQAITTELTEELLQKYKTVVLVDASLENQMNINEITRKNNINFISCSTYGLFGQIFCDFGDNFIVCDTDGEQIKSSFITNISHDEKNNYIIQCAEPHNLYTDDYVNINNVVSNHFEKLEDVIVKVVDRTSFKINLTEINRKKFNYVNGGTVTQIKKPKTYKFKPLKESIKNPEFAFLDMCDPEKNTSLHAYFQTLHKLGDKKKNINRKPTNILNDVIKLCPTANKELIRKLIHSMKGNLIPMQSVIGSIVAQEILKSCSFKFGPIFQWFYFEANECFSLPKNNTPKNHLEEENDNRYDGQTIVFGNEFQEKLSEQKLFIVGSGAIGCELLKNFGMMGVGNMIVTDMDTIEKSNLNRQFLFKSSDIGKAKSVAACNAISQMNPNVKMIAHQNKVGNETVSVYNEEFFNGLTCVANALDNVDARRYVDSLCVLYKKPLLESGTLGTKGNVQTIIPGLTESYGSTQDPPEQSVPVCTLKNFPYQIEHTIQYARDMFEGLFVQAPQNALKYIENPDFLKSLTSTDLYSVVNDIKKVFTNIPKNYNDCLKFAYKQWYELYRDQIRQLVEKFPPNHMTSSNIPFWSGIKKCPHELTFDYDDLNINFITSMANLWAQIFNQEIISDKKQIIQILKKFKIPEYVNKNTKISATEEDEKQRQKEEIENLDASELINSIPKIKLSDTTILKPLEFEKDDDTNFHIEFITATSNLRALNYNIETIDKHKTKGIAGKIIPAIATTTALVAGLVALEFYKVVMKINDIEKYRNSYVNLALPFIGMSEPIPCKKYKIKEYEFTFWDSFDIKNGKNMTIDQLLKYFKEKYKLDIMMVSYGQANLYSPFNVKRKDKKIIDIINETIGKEISSWPIILNVADDSDNDDVTLPNCKLYL